VDGDARRAIEAWLLRWSACVRAVDIEGARAMFEPDVVGFGTHVPIAHGLASLVREQWSVVWPVTEGFGFDLGRLDCVLAADGLMALVAVPWSSRGRDREGCTIERPGRATILLRRAHASETWRARHTHFSLNPQLE